MKILIFILSLISLSSAQSASCVFSNAFYGYTCSLTINNPDGIEITEITGDHLEGMTNADVVVIQRTSGTSAIFPSIFCSQFPNTERITFSSGGLTIISDTSFGGCSSLNYLRVLGNQIATISENAFANNLNLDYIDLDNNRFTTLPENLFANLRNLTILDLRNNNLTDSLPAGIFRDLINLEILYLLRAQLTEINPQWFATTTVLRTLDLYGNNFSELRDNDFVNLQAVTYLSLGGNQLRTLNNEVFRPMASLTSLSLNGNQLTEINENSFENLQNLTSIELSNNAIVNIAEGAFNGLPNLRYLYLTSCSITNLNENSFVGLSGLSSLNLNFNSIEDLPVGVFAPLANMSYLGLWANRLKTINRDIFGTDLSALSNVDLDTNVINAIERSVIKDAVNLNILHMIGNLCANSLFTGIIANRVQFMERLNRCFRNHEFSVDTETDEGVDFRFFNAPQPGIQFRVQTTNVIEIALTPFNFPWTPMIEILIGTANNTRTVIRRNREVDVVIVPTPNIIQDGQTNGFRVTWANHVILVFREGEEFPFIAHTMQDFYPVNFYGLRTPESRATWSIQPVDA